MAETTSYPGIDPVGFLEPLNSVQKQALLSYANGLPQNNLMNDYYASLNMGTQRFPQMAGAYMNPYQQSVINPTLNLINQEAFKGQQAQRERSARLGTSGGSGEALGLGNMEEKRLNAIGQFGSNLYNQGYQFANQAFNQDQNRMLGAAPGYGNLANTQLGLFNTQTQNQLAAGNVIQQQNQNKLAMIQQELAKKLGYPYQQSEFLANILKSYPTGSTTTTSQQGNAMQGALGGGLLGYSLGNQGFGNLFGFSSPSMYSSYGSPIYG
jgi:hypothetical protein